MREGEQIPAWAAARKNEPDEQPDTSGPPPGPRAGVLRTIGRSLLLRCPNCGRGKLFSSWFQMRSHCPACGMRLNRGESDYFIGAYTINLIVAELIAVGVMLIVLVETWPNVRWDQMKWAVLTLTIVAPFVTYPFSKSVWLALDLLFRPATLHDYNDDSPPENT
jgi:uncharacterized protein (DUF983 family)